MQNNEHNLHDTDESSIAKFSRFNNNSVYDYIGLRDAYQIVNDMCEGPRHGHSEERQAEEHVVQNSHYNDVRYPDALTVEIARVRIRNAARHSHLHCCRFTVTTRMYTQICIHPQQKLRNYG